MDIKNALAFPPNISKLSNGKNNKFIFNAIKYLILNFDVEK